MICGELMGLVYTHEVHAYKMRERYTTQEDSLGLGACVVQVVEQ